MAWYQTVLELIDMRSFSSLWYWIGLAVLWSSASHWVLWRAKFSGLNPIAAGGADRGLVARFMVRSGRGR